jgi:hypothetical protein
VRIVRAACLIAWLVLVGAACGADDESRQGSEPDPESGSLSTITFAETPTTHAEVPAEAVEPPAAVQGSPSRLLELARGLIPPEARDGSEEDLTVEECGIQPVFPCVREYFLTDGLTLRERVNIVRRQARSAGWRIVSVQRDYGATVKLKRGRYFADYMVEKGDPLLCQAAPSCVTGTMLTVVGPPKPLPAPSAEERASWSATKKAFIEDGNAICTRVEAHMKGPDDVVPAFNEGLKELSALRAPEGEEEQVSRVLRPLRNLVRAANALNDDDIGEDALPAAVAVGLFARRFNEAASRYGLETCAKLG